MVSMGGFNAHLKAPQSNPELENVMIRHCDSGGYTVTFSGENGIEPVYIPECQELATYEYRNSGMELGYTGARCDKHVKHIDTRHSTVTKIVSE